MWLALKLLLGKVPREVWEGAIVVILLAVGCSMIYHAGMRASDKDWQLRWQARDLSDATAAAAANAAHQQALSEAQKRNEEITDALNDKAAEAAAAQHDADIAKRLLAAAARAALNRGAVPEAGNQPAAPAPGGSIGDEGTRRLFGLVSDALTECRQNADRLDALQQEIRPQL